MTTVREVADAIARALQNTDHRDVGNIQTGSLGNVVTFAVYPRDRFGITSGEPEEFHAILRSGPFEAQL